MLFRSGPITRAAGDAVQPFVTERDATRATLENAAPALGAAEVGLREGTNLLSSVRNFSSAASQTLPAAPAGLTELSGLLGEGQAPLRSARPLLQSASSAVPGALEILTALDPVIPRVKEGLDLTRPALARIGERGCDLENFAAVMRSVTGFSQAGQGPGGPAMAFRLEAAPGGLHGLGITDPLYKRDGYSTPCKYLSKPYPQFIPKLGATP